jgi:hypothetical protein
METLQTSPQESNRADGASRTGKVSAPARKSERGQSLLELAISLIVLLMLLTGAVEFGLALFQYVTIRDAAQEGAVYASIMPTDIDGIKWRTMDAASDVVELHTEDVQVFVNGVETKVGDIAPNSCEGQISGIPNSIEVVTSFRHPITYPFVAEMIGHESMLLMGRATTTILQPICQ